MNAQFASEAYFDGADLSLLRARARTQGNDPAVLRQAARQFESLFVREMLKSMRQASLGDPLMESEATGFYRDMFDQQLALDLARSGGLGLADALVRQLSPGQNAVRPREGGYPLPPRQTPAEETAEAVERGDPQGFISALLPLARQAATRLGVAPEVLVAQAALETGWGRHVIRDADGRSSHNLFNIKAGSDWSGGTVVKSTLEFDADGLPYRERARFRAYPDYAASFRDYAEFVASRPRYREALARADDPRAYLEALAGAGYATDPRYADKIMAILSREPALESGLVRPTTPEEG